MTENGQSLEALKASIDPQRVPAHVAVIMDGNGRWAKEKGEERIFGHSNGVRSVRETLTGCTEIGVKYLTLYAFSTENWNRPQDEVNALMDLLVRTLASEMEELMANGVRINAIGDLDSLPQGCRETLFQAMRTSQGNTRITLTLALSYSSRWEMVRMVQRIANEVKEGRLAPDAIDEAVVERHLATNGMPDPELLIRTSGEQRISNFLLWQIAYAELHFSPVMWPDFDKAALFTAILDYQQRERRFGLISEQVNP